MTHEYCIKFWKGHQLRRRFIEATSLAFALTLVLQTEPSDIDVVEAVRVYK